MKYALKMIATAVFAIAIASCSPPPKFVTDIIDAVPKLSAVTVTSQAVVVGIQTFDVAKVGATGWLRLRRCDGTNGPICRDPAMLETVNNAVQVGTQARNDLKRWLRANPNGIADQTVYDKLTAATAVLERVASIYTAATR